MYIYLSIYTGKDCFGPECSAKNGINFFLISLISVSSYNFAFLAENGGSFFFIR